jgi:hypothetical protein
MGRQRWSSRLLVEQCRTLSTEVMQHDGVFRSPCGTSWRSRWFDNYGNCEASLDYWVIRSESLWLNVATEIHVGHREIALSGEQRIQIVASRPNFGGSRYWFLCQCGRRVGRLYLPPRRNKFACRRCYDLTYESSREHDARVYKLARNPFAVSAALESESWVLKVLGMRAALLRCRRTLRQ